MSGLNDQSRAPRRCREGRHLGTTLLEIIITMAVMTVGFLGYFTLYIQSFKLAKSATTMTEASNLAVAYMDLLQAIPYTPTTTTEMVFQDCRTLGYDPPSPSAPVNDLTCNTELPINVFGTRNGNQAPLLFFPSWDVEVIDATADPQQIRITVRVRYPSELGRCPGCTSSAGQNLTAGWKAVSVSSVRTTTAY